MLWIPAFAGMTSTGRMPVRPCRNIEPKARVCRPSLRMRRVLDPDLRRDDVELGRTDGPNNYVIPTEVGIQIRRRFSTVERQLQRGYP